MVVRHNQGSSCLEGKWILSRQNSKTQNKEQFCALAPLRENGNSEVCFFVLCETLCSSVYLCVSSYSYTEIHRGPQSFTEKRKIYLSGFGHYDITFETDANMHLCNSEF